MRCKFTVKLIISIYIYGRAIGRAIDIQSPHSTHMPYNETDRIKYEIRIIGVYWIFLFIFFFFFIIFLRFCQDWQRLCRESATNTCLIVSILYVLNVARETDNRKVRVTRFDRFMKDVILFLSTI
jgi:hypothetical protein